MAHASVPQDGIVVDAARQYVALRDRAVHPEGSFDKAGRWYPSETEQQGCCRMIRTPSRAWPYTLLKHCRTAEHIARRAGVDARELRKAARAC